MLWMLVCMYLCKIVFWGFILGGAGSIYPGDELLGHMVVLFLVFWETSILFSTVAISVYISSKRLPSIFVKLTEIQTQEENNQGINENKFQKWVICSIPWLKKHKWKFPGGPVVRIQCSYCQALGLIHIWETKIS